ncbi:RNA chaperone Hfq [Candidatus Sumerlaeota bacterium]|nr:RNA chaperone Hfq [Candidatus Sumerlaeota bacterium]
MAKHTMNLQDSFLNQVRRDSAQIKMVLIDGTTLTGSVRGFDNFTVIMANGDKQHLIYKHAIAQIVARRLKDHRTETRPPREDRAGTPDKPEANKPQAKPEDRARPPDRPEDKPGANKPQAKPAEKEKSTPRAEGKAPPKREGFNTLNLSHVMISDEAKE